LRLAGFGLLLCCLPPAAARPFEPLAHMSALRLLKQLSTEGCKDTVSVDIGGTLAKIVVFQPRVDEATPSEPLIAEAYRELSIYTPALGARPPLNSPPR